jgi:hypothetical protein
MGKIVAYSQEISGMGLYSKFIVGAWPGYGFLMVLFLMLISIIVWRTATDGNLRQYLKIKLWLVVAALFAFYCFVGIFDSNPRGYIQSIHWVLLICMLFYTLSISNVVKNKHLNKIRFFIYIFSLGSGYLLYQDRNPEFHIKLLVKHIAKEMELKQENYIQQVGWDSSIYMQYKSRKEFCGKFNGYVVLAYSIDYHPICLNDVGSYYFSTWGGESLIIEKMPRNKPLVVISHDDAKLKEFKKIYGNEFTIHGFYGLLESKQIN